MAAPAPLRRRVTPAPPRTGPPITNAPITDPPVEATYGGKIVVAGEAEVSNPWTPAAMQCDSFCQMRARTFFDPLITVDNDLNWRPYLAESITANDDNTVFTIKIREGITFTDGTDVNADAVMFNLNANGSGLLVSAAVKDLARDPACWTADGGLANLACSLVMEKVDDYTFTMATGFNGDASQPLPWPLFPYLGSQFGSSPPAVAGGRRRRQRQGRRAGGLWPFMFSSTCRARVASSSSSATRTTGTRTPTATSTPSWTRSSSV